MLCPVAATWAWVRGVIDLRFCPWAAGADLSVRRGGVAEALEEMRLVAAKGTSTSIVVLEPCSFEEYLRIAGDVDAEIDDAGLRGVVQLATFHPEYRFEEGGGVGDWTNRSPYPLLHFLHEDDVARALRNVVEDPDEIWRRNIRTCEQLGPAKLRALLWSSSHYAAVRLEGLRQLALDREVAIFAGREPKRVGDAYDAQGKLSDRKALGVLRVALRDGPRRFRVGLGALRCEPQLPHETPLLPDHHGQDDARARDAAAERGGGYHLL
ncbi:hypothetical protein CTAYLR_000558 [Chrysophaeum taylorii]|uniref:Uncharacterized protein n=1 Tax=Chrysophaeum taylorii TaxID=2483200 RepID=A0AAD7UHM1_9STRA|nr:hypothetical protein CTAYLR_000558 [Chrysophaeum taylorii]